MAAVAAVQPPRIRILSPLRIRDFALLWTGMTVSFIGDGLYMAAPFYAQYAKVFK